MYSSFNFIKPICYAVISEGKSCVTPIALPHAVEHYYTYKFSFGETEEIFSMERGLWGGRGDTRAPRRGGAQSARGRENLANAPRIAGTSPTALWSATREVFVLNAQWKISRIYY